MNMKITSHLAIGLISLIFLFSCTRENPVITQFISTTKTPDKPFTETLLPTLTSNSAELINLTPSTSRYQAGLAGESCLSLKPENHLYDKLKNSVLIVDDYDKDLVYAINAEDSRILFTSEQAPLAQGRNLMMSPNQKMLSYTRSGENADSVVVIIDSSGRQVATYPLTEDIGFVYEWLNNDEILAQKSGDQLVNIFVINPFLQTIKTLSSSFENFYDINSPVFWIPSYDLNLRFVVFPNKPSADNEEGYILWDSWQQKVIWQKRSLTASKYSPAWSPARDRFAVAINSDSTGLRNKFELYIVQIDGNILIETTLNRSYSDVYISDILGWSPDGKYLAFWLTAQKDSSEEENRFPQMALLDTRDGTIINYCISGYGVGYDVVWAPDSEHFIVFSDEQVSNLLVDILDNEVENLDISGRVVFWMRK